MARVRNKDEIAVLEKTYESIAIEYAKDKYYNVHSQNAYIEGFMKAVKMYVKPKKRSEEQIKEGSLLQVKQ